MSDPPPDAVKASAPPTKMADPPPGAAKASSAPPPGAGAEEEAFAPGESMAQAGESMVDAAGESVAQAKAQAAASEEKVGADASSKTNTAKLKKITAKSAYGNVTANLEVKPENMKTGEDGAEEEAVVEDDDNPFQGSIKMIALGRTDGTVVSWWFSEVSL